MVNKHRNGNDDVKPTTINFNTVRKRRSDLFSLIRRMSTHASKFMSFVFRYLMLGRKVEEDEALLSEPRRSSNGWIGCIRTTTKKLSQIRLHLMQFWMRGRDRVIAWRPIAPSKLSTTWTNYIERETRVSNQTPTRITLWYVGIQCLRCHSHRKAYVSSSYCLQINAWAKSGEKGAASRAEQVLSIMERRYRDGDQDFKPNTRTHTSVIDAWAKSGELGAARRAEQILNAMQANYEASGDPEVRPNVHSANAVCNVSCCPCAGRK